MTTPNTDIAPVQANQTQPYLFSKNPYTNVILPVTRWSLPKGSARIAVVWCPLCDYSQQVTMGNACRKCGSLYSYDDPNPVEVEDDFGAAEHGPVIKVIQVPPNPDTDSLSAQENRKLETQDSPTPGREPQTNEDTYCGPCGRQLMNASGLSAHQRSKGHAARLELLAKSGD